MDNELQKKRQFRIEQSEEKLRISEQMIKRTNYNDAVVFSYLAMFYAMRTLLLEKHTDTDNISKIIEIYEKYYSQTVWADIDIVAVIKECKQFKDKIENTPGIIVSKDDANKYFNSAQSILKEIKILTSSSSQIST